MHSSPLSISSRVPQSSSSPRDKTFTDIVSLFGTDKCLWGDSERRAVREAFHLMRSEGMLELAKVMAVIRIRMLTITTARSVFLILWQR